MGFQIFSGLSQIIGETFKIFFKNWKLISTITLLHIFLNSILFFPNLFSTEPSDTQFSTNLTDIMPFNRNTTSNKSLSLALSDYFAHLTTAVKVFLPPFVGAKFLVYVAGSLVSSFFATAIILVSSTNYISEKELQVKKLLSMVGKSWKRAFLTSFYTDFLSLVYMFFVLAIFLTPFVNPRFVALILISDTVFIVALIFYLYYISIVWALALVVSVLEEKCGFEALKEASELLKGLGLKGFLLSLLFESLPSAMMPTWIMDGNDGRDLPTIIKTNFAPLLTLKFVSSVAKLFFLISYTALYYECKKIHGKRFDEMFSGPKLEAKSIPFIVSVDHERIDHRGENFLLRSRISN